MSVGPFTAKKMRVSITEDGTTYVLGVVEVARVAIYRNGRIEFLYGTKGPAYDRPKSRHRVGMKRVEFTIRRWFKADDNNTDLLFDLHDSGELFQLDEYLTETLAGMVGLTLSGCVGYSYRLITGSANDIMAEECRGNCLDWVKRT